MNINRIFSSDSHPPESSDDILAKYRRSIPGTSPQKSSSDSPLPSTNQNSKSLVAKGDDDEADNTPPAYDPSNLEACKAFLDAKKKLRMVLSNADFHAMPSMATCGAGGLPGSGGGYGSVFSVRSQTDRRENDLVGFLKVQLAEAINLQDKGLIAQLHETIRCLRLFDNHE